MKTKVIVITDPVTQVKDIEFAASLITKGQVVAFPTETVYGLGADAMNPKAVKGIFSAKDRPADNPLIVHISNKKQLKHVVKEITKPAKQLMDAFWPGPLSIVLPKHKDLPSITTAGLDSVVVRFPSHPIAQALITKAGTPIAAPSANLSGKVSPTKAEHVIEDLNNKIPLIIDGGDIEYGLESTVVDCTANTPVVLRPGSITLEMLQKIIPGTRNMEVNDPRRSPGMKYRHYAPVAPIILFSGSPNSTAKTIKKYISGNDTEGLVLIWHTGNFSYVEQNHQLPANSYEAAPLLFSILRSVDKTSVKKILIQGYTTDGLGTAIMNRLVKASSEIIYP